MRAKSSLRHSHRIEGVLSIIVPPCGPAHASVAIIGEAPGRHEAEANRPRPFVGQSGIVQRDYFAQFGFNVSSAWLSNIVQLYRPGNPDPEPELIAEWSRVLERDLSIVRPQIIIAVGRFAMRWFLGDYADLDICYGRPFTAGEYDPTLAHRGFGAIIIPVYHPAGALREPKRFDLVREGYRRAAAIIDKSRRGIQIELTHDYIGADTEYIDLTGDQTKAFLNRFEDCEEIAIDTEGTPDDPESVQWSCEPGTGYLLRVTQPDFARGISALQSFILDRRVIAHAAHTPLCGFYEHVMCRAMNLDLHLCWEYVDTMYWLYLMRLESRALKSGTARWCGMSMTPYDVIMGDLNRSYAIDYLTRIANLTWPAIPPRTIFNNDGTRTVKKYTSPARRASGILRDISAGKITKTGLTDPIKRWNQDRKQAPVRQAVHNLLGPMPHAKLFRDVELEIATEYACADPDGTLRLKRVLEPELADLGMLGLAETAKGSLPLFELMQHNGMHANISHFDNLGDHLQEETEKVLRTLKNTYTGGVPLNVKSPKQIAIFLQRRGVPVTERTKAGNLSTSKKALTHLRATDPAVDLIFIARELITLQSMFCAPIRNLIENNGAALIDDEDDSDDSESESIIADPDSSADSDTRPADVRAYAANICQVRTSINALGTVSRRPATNRPNMLAIPQRTELGRMIRAGFVPSHLDNVLIEYDLRQAEMVCAAILSNDKRMLKIFLEGRDIHKETASALFNMPIADLTKAQRDPTKTMGFGTLYGMAEHALIVQLRMQGIEWTLEQGRLFKISWLAQFPQLDQYMIHAAAKAAKLEYAIDRWGMRRYLPLVRSNNFGERAEAGRQAVSLEIQGFAQGLIQNSMAWMYKVGLPRLRAEGINAMPLLQMHDALLFETHRDHSERVSEVILEALTQHVGCVTRVPIEADGHAASNWGDLKG